MSRVTGVVFLILIGSCSAFAQPQDSYDYESEFNWGVNKNSSGGLIGGFIFKKAKKIKFLHLVMQITLTIFGT